MKRILVVGAGPVGMSLALSLNKFGIQFDLLEKNPIRSKNSKALTLTSSSLKSLAKLDVEQEIIKNGKQISNIDIYHKHKKIASINKSNLPSKYNYYLSIPQYKTESILEKKLTDLNINIETGKIIGINHNKKNYKVELLVKDSIIKREYDYIIGCDGASSDTRKILDIPFVGKDYKTQFLITDIDINDKFPIKKTSYFSLDSYFIGIFPISNNKIRTVISNNNYGFNKLNKESDVLNYINIEFEKFFKIKALACSIFWHTKVDIKQLYAGNQFPKNIYLLGDAWHIYSPVGGQTLNTGFQDAIDLGWRLALNIKGLANKKLLDEFISHRSIAHEKVKYITDLYTEILIGNNFMQEDQMLFPLSLYNRHLYKKAVPETFAGYSLDHNNDSHTTIVGKYISFVDLSTGDKKNTTYKLTYKKFTLLSYIDIHNDLSSELIDIIIVNEEVMLSITGNSFKKNNCLLVSPSGFIYKYDILNDILLSLKKTLNITEN